MAEEDDPDADDPDARPGGDGPSSRQPSTRPMLITLGVIAFVYSYQQIAVVPAIPTIRASFGTSAAWSAWLLSGYLIVATVLTPSLGRLADLRGEARVLLGALAVFGAGSVGAATLPGLPAVILCRAAQGSGGAVLPLLFALARRHLPDERVGTAIARLTAAFGLGAVAGFGSGGAIAATVSWRLIFGLGASLVATGIGLLLWWVPRDRGIATGKFDVVGAISLGAASMSVLLALTLGEQWGWPSAIPVALLAAGALAAAGWVRIELRNPEPVVDLRVLRDASVWRVNVATVGLGWGRFAGLLLVPELVRGPGGSAGYGFAADATLAGIYLLPDGVGTLLGGRLGGTASRRQPPGRVYAGGLALLAAGSALLAAGPQSLPAVLAGVLLLGLGSGVGVQASSAVTTRDVPPEHASASSSLNSTVRRFAGGIGSQVSIAILAASAATGSSVSSGAAGGGGGSAVAVGGFRVAFGVAAALSLAGAVTSLTIGDPAA